MGNNLLFFIPMRRKEPVTDFVPHVDIIEELADQFRFPPQFVGRCVIECEEFDRFSEVAGCMNSETSFCERILRTMCHNGRIVTKLVECVFGKRFFVSTDSYSHVSAEELEHQRYKVGKLVYHREVFLLISVALF